MVDLLPINATASEKTRAIVMTRLSEIDVPIKHLWNPETCPAPLLPYLAWAFRVEHWNSEWSEERQRKVIAASWDVHAHKGTRHAIISAIEALEISVDIQEWFEVEGMERGTFSLRAKATPEMPLTLAEQNNIMKLADSARRYSQHPTILMSADNDASMKIAMVTLAGQKFEGEAPAPINGAHPQLSVGAAILVKNTMTANLSASQDQTQPISIIGAISGYEINNYEGHIQ